MTEKEIKNLVSKPITLEDFCMDGFSNVHFDNDERCCMSIHWELCVITVLESLRLRYNATYDERYLTELLRLLPSSYKGGEE